MKSKPVDKFDKFNAAAIRAANSVKTSEENMSEQHEVVENDEDTEVTAENGRLTFTLSSWKPEFDVKCSIDPNGFEGMDVNSFIKMAGVTYKHIIGSERSSAGKGRNVEKFPNREDFELNWARSKVKTILSGEYAEGGRASGPRLDPVAKEWRQLVIDKLLKPNWSSAKAFPVSGTALIEGTSLNDWVKLCQDAEQRPQYAYLKDMAIANVEKARQEAADAAAKRKPGVSGFASV